MFHCLWCSERAVTTRISGTWENGMAEKISLAFIEEERQKGVENPNWTFVMSRLHAAVNGSKNHGPGGHKPYEHVFGVPYDRSYDGVSTNQIRACNAMEEVDRLLNNDPVLHSKFVQFGLIQDSATQTVSLFMATSNLRGPYRLGRRWYFVELCTRPYCPHD
jgi:hypothetical protein